VEDGVNGFVVDAGDLDVLAERIARLLADPEAARKMGAAGFDTSRAATIETGQRALETLFARVLEGRAHVLA
jgi:glycosyltransferase involved in cell wall biosynthesis